MTGLSETSFHQFRISTTVGAGENDDHLGANTIPNEIRESTNDCSANVAMHNLINERSLGQSVKDSRNL